MIHYLAGWEKYRHGASCIALFLAQLVELAKSLADCLQKFWLKCLRHGNLSCFQTFLVNVAVVAAAVVIVEMME